MKMKHAGAMVERWGIRRQMLVDDLEGTVHHAFGTLPNMTYIIGPRGRVTYRANWTDARSIETVLEQLLHQRKARKSRTRMVPFYVEWIPERTADRTAFLEGLLAEAGSRAIEEFIAAVTHVEGDSAARGMREWWEQHSK